MDKFIVSTRPEGKFSKLDGEYCFKVLNVPLTKIVEEPAITGDQLDGFDPQVCVFTSSTGVRTFLKRFGKAHLVGRSIIAIGKHTADPLIQASLDPILPETYDSAGIRKVIGELFKGKRIALLRSNMGSSELTDFLSSNNYEFKEFVVYRVEPLKSDLSILKTPGCIGVLLTSSYEASIVLDFLESVPGLRPKMYAIGKTTAEFLAGKGISPGSEVPNSNFKEALEIIKKKICDGKE